MIKPSDPGGLFFRRVVVVGVNGAGKTWFAVRLARHLAVSVVHLDALKLTTHWRQKPRAIVQADLSKAAKGPAWVLEGGPSILSSAVMARAELVVWLDVPARLRAWRIVRRSLRYAGQTRPEHPPGNRDWPGRRQLQFVWRALVAGDWFAQAIEARLSECDVPLVRLRTKAEVARFLEEE